MPVVVRYKHPQPMALVRVVGAPWWRRLLARLRRRPTEYCAHCGEVRDSGQRLPRGTGIVCDGSIRVGDRWRCFRFMVVHG
jgi:hypothetical protein